jgi:hypothetical protein
MRHGGSRARLRELALFAVMGQARASNRAGRGLMAQRSSLHLADRVTCRLRFGFLFHGRSPTKAVLATAFALYDCAGAWWLARSGERPYLLPRLVADCADMALWAALEDEAYVGVVNIGDTLCGEAGARYGLAGLGIPLAQAVSVTIARRLVGKRSALPPLIWPAISVFGGWGLRSYEQRRLARLRAANETELAARVERARLAGQHSVAMGADPIVDLLVRTTVLMEPDIGVPRQDPIHAWKGRLAEQARDKATYLADATRGWARDHNTASPILADNVQATVEVGGDQVLLTGGQVRAFRQQLDRLRLRGDVVLTPTLTGSGHIAGRRLTISVNHLPALELPADPVAVPPPMQPGPLALGVMVPWLLTHSVPAFDNAPLSRTLPTAAAAAVAAGILYRRANRNGRDVSMESLAASLTLAFVHTAIVSPSIRNDVWADGGETHPCVTSLFGPTALASIYWHGLAGRRRVAVVASFAAVVGVDVLLRPWPTRLRELILAGSVLVAAAGAAMGWGSVLVEQTGLVADEFRVTAERAQQEAFRQGRREVLDLVVEAVELANRRFEETCERIPSRLAATIADRLDALLKRTERLSSEIFEGTSELECLTGH